MIPEGYRYVVIDGTRCPLPNEVADRMIAEGKAKEPPVKVVITPDDVTMTQAVK